MAIPGRIIAHNECHQWLEVRPYASLYYGCRGSHATPYGTCAINLLCPRTYGDRSHDGCGVGIQKATIGFDHTIGGCGLGALVGLHLRVSSLPGMAATPHTVGQLEVDSLGVKVRAVIIGQSVQGEYPCLGIGSSSVMTDPTILQSEGLSPCCCRGLNPSILYPFSNALIAGGGGGGGGAKQQ